MPKLRMVPRYSMPDFEAMRFCVGVQFDFYSELGGVGIVPVELHSVLLSHISNDLQPWEGIVANDGHRSLGEVCRQHRQNLLDRLGDTLFRLRRPGLTLHHA